VPNLGCLDVKLKYMYARRPKIIRNSEGNVLLFRVGFAALAHNAAIELGVVVKMILDDVVALAGFSFKAP